MSSEPVKILLVEDSAADAEMTMRTLRRGALVNSIEWVRDGVEALDYMTCAGKYADRINGNPRLVLLDLKMPRLDGLQLLAHMRADPRLATIPVVMMTSSREEADLVESYRQGANSYVVKPVESTEFAETVARVGMYWILANVAPQ